ncbi:MAG: hypothetical protein HUJ31_06745, partial [Pseudomonadales bacterium]|nr:hypothetical protein [Pseudomonadales bacterium]
GAMPEGTAGQDDTDTIILNIEGSKLEGDADHDFTDGGSSYNLEEGDLVLTSDGLYRYTGDDTNNFNPSGANLSDQQNWVKYRALPDNGDIDHDFTVAGTYNLKFGDIVKGADGEVYRYKGASDSSFNTADADYSDLSTWAKYREGTLYATAGGDIRITAVSVDNVTSRLYTDQVLSNEGDVTLTAYHGIYAKDDGSLIQGERVELDAKAGFIGSDALSIDIDSDRDGLDSTGGFSARATDDIFIEETIGDLKVVLAKAWPGDGENPLALGHDVAVISDLGNIELRTLDGNILDGDTELFRPGDRGDALTWDDLSAAQKAEFPGGKSSQEAKDFLARASTPLSPGLIAAVLPHTELLGLSPNTDTPENTNVQAGGNVVLVAGGAGGDSSGIGRLSGIQSIDLSNGIDDLDDEEKEVLATARASDVIGQVYRLYMYTGTSITDNSVDLTDMDFTGGDWTEIEVDVISATSRSADDPKSVANGDYVLVQYSADEYGVYKYKGTTNSSLNLRYEVFLNNTARWEPVAPDHFTYGSANALAVEKNVTQVRDGNYVYLYTGENTSLLLPSQNYAEEDAKVDGDWTAIAEIGDWTDNADIGRYLSSHTGDVDVYADENGEPAFQVKDGNFVYGYVGAARQDSPVTVDFSTIDFANDADWEQIGLEIISDFTPDNVDKFLSTYQNQQKDLLNGQIVADQHELAHITIQLLDDLDVEAPGTLTVDAGNDTIIGTTSDFDIHHVK